MACGMGLLPAACVLRCVAKIVMVEWQTCMMFMCACAHHVFVLEIDLCGSTARSFAESKCLLLFCVSSVQFVCACVLLFLAWRLLDRVGRACCLDHVSFCVECRRSPVVLCGLFANDGRGDGAQTWHVVWGCCLLRAFCVALQKS